MSQKIHVNRFNWVEDLSKFNEDFLKSHYEKSNLGYSLKVEVQHRKNFHEPQNHLPFLPETKKVDKGEKRTYYKLIKSLKQALNHRRVFKKIKVIKFNGKTWFKTYVDMNA